MKLPEFDFRFVELFYELYALEQYMDSVESQLPDLIKKEEEKAYGRLRQEGYENDPFERQYIQQQLYDLIEEVLPRYFFSPILVTLWAIFESAITEIAKEVKDQQNQVIKLNDINGDLLERANKYFNHIIKISIKTRDSSWQHLRMFYILRNAIAHANGRLDNIKSEEDIRKIKKWSNDNIGIDNVNGNLIFSSEFVRKTYSVVFKVIKDLTNQVTTQYPKPINW
jgi:hypothetical protein